MFPVLRVRGERKENRTARAGEETGWENTVVCTRMRARTHTQQVLPRGGSEQAHASAGGTRFCREHTLLQVHALSCFGSVGPAVVTNKSAHPPYLYPKLAHSNHFAAL